MMRKNTGKIMPADCVRPCVDNRLDLTFGRSALLHHGSRSNRWLMYVPEDERRGADPTRRIIFMPAHPAIMRPLRQVDPGTSINAFSTATPHRRSIVVPPHGDFDSFSFHPSQVDLI